MNRESTTGNGQLVIGNKLRAIEGIDPKVKSEKIEVRIVNGEKATGYSLQAVCCQGNLNYKLRTANRKLQTSNIKLPVFRTFRLTDFPDSEQLKPLELLEPFEPLSWWRK